MPIYSKAPIEVCELLTKTIDLYHPALRDAEVTFDVLMAEPTLNRDGEPTGPAVKHHGVACAAMIRTVSYKDRVKGGADLEIVIDQRWWDVHDEEQQIALLDHECNHRTLKQEEDNSIKSDEIGRPLFNNVPHDFEIGVFAATAMRHGVNSVDVEVCRNMIASDRWKNSIQKFLPGLEPIDVSSEEGDDTPVAISSSEEALHAAMGQTIRRPSGASKRK